MCLLISPLDCWNGSLHQTSESPRLTQLASHLPPTSVSGPEKPERESHTLFEPGKLLSRCLLNYHFKWERVRAAYVVRAYVGILALDGAPSTS